MTFTMLNLAIVECMVANSIPALNISSLTASSSIINVVITQHDEPVLYFDAE